MPSRTNFAAIATALLLCWWLTGCGDLFGGGGTGGGAPTASAALPPGAVEVGAGQPVASSPILAPLPPVPSGMAMPMSFAPLAKRADPAVATVRSEVRSSSGRRILEGLGTAFVYDPSGYLLTNNHVIAEATNITVSFVDGREFEASVVGRDPPTDVAIIKVQASNLPALPLGDSDALLVGDWVVAIGNPFGLSHTVSAGILSAKGRTRDDVKGLPQEGYYHFLQTDAAINQGNSGGPLINLRGEVVGVNTAVRANANNIGFAIPVNMVKQIMPMLLQSGKVSRSRLGVEVLPLDQETAKTLKRPDLIGAWVNLVAPGGPADKAGLAVDDVILEFDGKKVKDPNDLRWLASIHGVSKPAKVRVARGAREFELTVTLGALDE